GTRLEWTGGVSYDYYQNNSRGGFTLTPIRDESANNTGQVQTEIRSTGGDGAVSWFTFGATFSDDRAVLDHPTLINNMQLGHAGETYRVALGDVPVGFSTLGTNTGLRGLFGEGYLGSTLFQAVLGVQSDTWESIAKEERRTRYLRNSYAFKVEQPFGESFSAYLTTQGYADDEDEATATTTGLAAADGNATTLGFSFRQGGFTLTGEGGASDWEEEGYADESDEAWILDAAWQGERFGLQAGYHDLGLFYTSLSGDALSGVSEAYGNVSWMAASWLSLTGDLRHTENERAEAPPGLEQPVPVPYTPNAVEADSWTLGADIAVLAVEGLSLQLSHSQSDGENDDGGENDQQDSAASLQFSRGGWSTGLGWQHGDYENAAAAASDSDTDGWNAFVGREWVEPANGTWNVGATLMYADQRQELDTGEHNTNESYQLSLNGQHVRFGQFSAMWYDGRVRDPSTGQDLDQRGIQVEAGRALGRYGSLKFYFSRNDSFDDRADIAYMERTLGVQFMSAF
ncbi:MAG: hypothetical protein IT486_07590, partial [Gammaproteobacteria bacterium]|nr:hypothetical protein [Gammaproteobacteria bacterium]